MMEVFMCSGSNLNKRNLPVSLLCKSVKVLLLAFVAVESVKMIHNEPKHGAKADYRLINIPTHFPGQYFVQSPAVKLTDSKTQTIDDGVNNHNFRSHYESRTTMNQHNLPQIIPGMPHFAGLQAKILSDMNRRRQGASSHNNAEGGGEKTENKGEEMQSFESPHGETEMDLSPFEQAIKNLTTPEQLIPIINDLTFITLIILHLPAIIPVILIPLAFYGVGALLIPFVRVNYFINHKDDHEDGRYLTSGTDMFNFIFEQLWLWW